MYFCQSPPFMMVIIVFYDNYHEKVCDFANILAVVNQNKVIKKKDMRQSLDAWMPDNSTL
jgi:hypothetical protein